MPQRRFSEDEECVGKALKATWQPGFILLGVSASFVGSYVSLMMMRYARVCMVSNQWRAYKKFLTAAGVSLGGSAIWTMHFVGMTAIRLETCEHHVVRVSYNDALTFLSMISAIVCTGLSMHIVMPKLTKREIEAFAEEAGEQPSKKPSKRDDARDESQQIRVEVFGTVLVLEKVNPRRFFFAAALLTIAALTMQCALPLLSQANHMYAATWACSRCTDGSPYSTIPGPLSLRDFSPPLRRLLVCTSLFN